MDRTGFSMNSGHGAPAGALHSFLHAGFGYLVGAACLVWVLHDVHPRELLRSMTGIHWGWVSLAVAANVLSYVCQGWRWELLLRPAGRITVLRATQAIYVGLFANEVLPMRLGEIARTFLVSRWLSASFTSVLPSVVVERLFDGAWLALSMGLTAIVVPLPPNLEQAGNVLGAVMVVATVLFLYLMLRRPAHDGARGGAAWKWRPLRWLASFFGDLESGLRGIGMSREFYVSFAVSLLFLLGQILAFWLIMLAFGLKLSFWVGAIVSLIVHLGTTIPNAPANVGTYQFFVVVGLSLFGVEKTAATAFSFVVFILLTVPLWVLGLLALNHAGMTLASMRAEIRGLAG